MLTKTLKDKRNNEYLVTLLWDKDAKYIARDKAEPQFGMYELTIKNKQDDIEVAWLRTSINVCKHLDDLGFQATDAASFVTDFKSKYPLTGYKEQDEWKYENNQRMQWVKIK